MKLVVVKCDKCGFGATVEAVIDPFEKHNVFVAEGICLRCGENLVGKYLEIIGEF